MATGVLYPDLLNSVYAIISAFKSWLESGFAQRRTNYIPEGFLLHKPKTRRISRNLLSIGEYGLCVELHTQKSHCKQEP